jgi:hypothetical protein
MLSEIFDQPKAVAHWTRIFDAMYERRGPDTWDYQWTYTAFKNNSLTIVPSTNLVANIGFGHGSTHTSGVDSRLTPPVEAIEFPLRHPSSFNPMRSMDLHFQSLYYAPLFQRVWGKLRRVVARLRV